jgi:hypothetical protein
VCYVQRSGVLSLSGWHLFAVPEVGKLFDVPNLVRCVRRRGHSNSLCCNKQSLLPFYASICSTGAFQYAAVTICGYRETWIRIKTL